MGKTVSATTVRTQLARLLDELQAGQSHFIIERNDEPAAVLMSMQKFIEIVRTLEMIAAQDYIAAEMPEPHTPTPLPEGAILPAPAAALAEFARELNRTQEATKPPRRNLRIVP